MRLWFFAQSVLQRQIIFELQKIVFIFFGARVVNSRISYYFFCPPFKISLLIIERIDIHEYLQEAFINQADDGLLVFRIAFAYRIHQGKIVLV